MFDNLGFLSAVAVILLACIIAAIWMIQGRVAPREKPQRFCPLCKSELAENETLKALIVDTNPPQKILIRGCTKCAPVTEGGSW